MEQQQHYEYDQVDKNRKQQSRLKREGLGYAHSVYRPLN